MEYTSDIGISEEAIDKLHAIENEILSWLDKAHDHDEAHPLSTSHNRDHDATDI